MKIKNKHSTKLSEKFPVHITTSTLGDFKAQGLGKTSNISIDSAKMHLSATILSKLNENDRKEILSEFNANVKQEDPRIQRSQIGLDRLNGRYLEFFEFYAANQRESENLKLDRQLVKRGLNYTCHLTLGSFKATGSSIQKPDSAIKNSRRKLAFKIANSLDETSRKDLFDSFISSCPPPSSLNSIKKRIEKANRLPINIVQGNVDEFNDTFQQYIDSHRRVEADKQISSSDTILDNNNLNHYSKEFKNIVKTPIIVPNNLPNLPISTMYTEIIEAIESNQVTIISASTGAGKTTQIPQFLLSRQDPLNPVNVFVTQPRVVAATSVATRVASERNEPLGKSIGYHVRYESKNATSPNGRVSMFIFNISILDYWTSIKNIAIESYS